MQDDAYQVVRYQPEYKDHIIELQAHLWGPDIALNRRYFEWKYESNPYQSPPCIYMVLHGGRPVAMRGFMGSRWQAGIPHRTATCLLMGDSVTHPSHRRLGLFERITVTALKELSSGPHAYVFVMSSGPLSTSGNLKLGFTSLGANLVGTRLASAQAPSPGRVRQLVRRLPYMPALYRGLRARWRTVAPTRSLPASPTNATRAFETLDRRMGTSSGSGIAVTRQPDAGLLAGFVSECCRDGRMRQVRDEVFFRWRYANPRCEYRFLLAGAASLDGYLVLRESHYPRRRELQIVDWEVRKPAVLEPLLRVAVSESRCDALTVWATTLSSDEHRVFQGAGFCVGPEMGGLDEHTPRPSVLIRPLTEPGVPAWALSPDGLLGSTNWDLRSVYSDGS